MKKNILYFLALLLVLQKVSLTQFSDSRVADMRSQLDSIIAPVRDAGITVSAKVMHGDYGKVLYEYNPEIKMIPASITKLITSACAFNKLGQSYEFITVVYTDDNNLSGGKINGNLYLKGFGDPDLSSEDIQKLADILSKSNIKEITGNIVADETYFDNEYHGLANYYSGDTGPSYWPYVNALALNKNNGNSNHAMDAASLLSSDLVSAGIIVDGTAISGSTPNGAKELGRVSKSIYDVISNMDKESDNHSAITIFKLLGAKLISPPGSLDKGQQVVESFLSEIGVDRYSYEILEGSGLTRYNKVNADLYIKLLKYMYDDRFLFDYYFNALSIAGKDGTLRNRMIGTEAEGNVHAKTGTLNGVSSLCGYDIDADNEILIFFIVMNGFGGSTKPMHDIQDDFCVALAHFSRK
ncbi:MAG: D-alanyl-D-alanine carboxypeptidase/D-alanyl-D-alanine-endopeptidase [Ignavibacteria bacterium]